MPDYLPGMAMSAVALIAGLIATYVSLQNRALLAEVRKELAELENRIFTRIDGTFVRAGECKLREANVTERLGALAREFRCLAGSGRCDEEG